MIVCFVTLTFVVFTDISSNKKKSIVTGTITFVGVIIKYNRELFTSWFYNFELGGGLKKANGNKELFLIILTRFCGVVANCRR